jgi:hypothetical protein
MEGRMVSPALTTSIGKYRRFQLSVMLSIVSQLSQIMISSASISHFDAATASKARSSTPEKLASSRRSCRQPRTPLGNDVVTANAADSDVDGNNTFASAVAEAGVAPGHCLE